MRKIFLLLGIVATSWLLAFCTEAEKNVAEDTTVVQSVSSEYTVAAYVWPSCHHDERFGDMLWPEGTGEWEVIKKGTARFNGHYQPKAPLWGYEMDDNPQVMEKWIDAATDHGVNTFIFDWYWFDEGPFLESSLNNGFLKAPNREKIDFYLMWANHDVKQNYWNVHKYPDVDTLLWDGAVDLKNFKIVVDRVITQYFSQPNYHKIDSMPVFSIFSLTNLTEGLGGLEATQDALNYFREQTIAAGFPGLHLQAILFGNPNQNAAETVEALNFNSATQYNWGWMKEQDYLKWGAKAIERRNAWAEQLKVPLFPNASIGWDDTPRFPAKGEKDIVRYNKSPESFAAYLQEAKEYCDDHPDQAKLITIFSWNEWIEGGYLLPDRKYGFEYLQAVKEVTEGSYDQYSNQQ
ncbi:glycosyltransferase WbsX family protein [Tunicatimonas pelagia]|uniref:glycosyltransferase WbsX family protein n=1 Tax=Tunicatimonas pelagia TaxID=931531 RepID=UPI0026665B99|nr:glycoside hydrolase family 99-like domain-containing protein [Tunicatimonas pelagia]WKN45667.1 glycoside hydrolase family 99-like domain-containing protein [Tunicatimonas pelagia]